MVELKVAWLAGMKAAQMAAHLVELKGAKKVAKKVAYLGILLVE